MKNTKNVKKGDKIRVLCMLGEEEYTEKTGFVEHIDDAGQLHGSWGGLAILPDKDEFEIIENEDKK